MKSIDLARANELRQMRKVLGRVKYHLQGGWNLKILVDNEDVTIQFTNGDLRKGLGGQLTHQIKMIEGQLSALGVDVEGDEV